MYWCYLILINMATLFAPFYCWGVLFQDATQLVVLGHTLMFKSQLTTTIIMMVMIMMMIMKMVMVMVMMMGNG